VVRVLDVVGADVEKSSGELDGVLQSRRPLDRAAQMVLTVPFTLIPAWCALRMERSASAQ